MSERDQAETGLKEGLVNGIEELNIITGMSVSSIHVCLSNTQQIPWKPAKYVVENIRITYE